MLRLTFDTCADFLQKEVGSAKNKPLSQKTQSVLFFYFLIIDYDSLLAQLHYLHLK